VQTSVAGLYGQPTAEPEQTVQAHCDQWIALQRAKVDADQKAADHANNQAKCLSYFADWIGGQAGVGSIDGQKLAGFYSWCLAREEWSLVYAKKIFGVAKMFIRWLAELDVIPPLKNIDSRSFTFKDGPKAVPTWTTEEFKTVLAAASGQFRLHLLLMVNCGYTQSDIAELADDEVDWTAGRITRKRSKTRDQANVPVVSYPLWPATFELLKEYRSGGPVVLLTRSGGSWRYTRQVNGKLVHCDNIASLFLKLKAKLPDFKKTLKELRKTAASLLEGHEVYGRFVSLFLGHSPRGVKERHYAAPAQALFDEAVLWLGQQLTS
jgi:integrase